MGLIIEKVENGFVVGHHERRHTASAEHVANFICMFWPDVAQSVHRRMAQQPRESLTEGDQSPHAETPFTDAITNY